MARPVVLVVDLDILMCRKAVRDSAAGTSGPAPSFTYTSVTRPQPGNAHPANSSSGEAESQAPSPASPAPAHAQTCHAWLRPGVRRFLLAVQPYADTVLLVRQHGSSSSSSRGCRGASDGNCDEEVDGLTSSFVTTALSSVDPDRQFFGNRVFLARQQRSEPRSQGARHCSSAVAANGGSSTCSTIKLLHDLEDLFEALHGQAAIPLQLLVATTADRAHFGSLSDRVIECPPYRREYGMYDDVLDCLANVVTDPQLTMMPVPAALRRLGLLHARLQPSPVMQALQTQVVMRLVAGRMQGQGCQGQGQSLSGQGSGSVSCSGRQQQARRQQQQQQYQQTPPPQQQQRQQRKEEKQSLQHPHIQSPPPPSSLYHLQYLPSQQQQQPQPLQPQQHHPRSGGSGNSRHQPSSPPFPLPSIPEQPLLETCDALEAPRPASRVPKTPGTPAATSSAGSPPRRSSGSPLPASSSVLQAHVHTRSPPSPSPPSCSSSHTASSCCSSSNTKAAAANDPGAGAAAAADSASPRKGGRHRKAWSEGCLVMMYGNSFTFPSTAAAPPQQQQKHGSRRVRLFDSSCGGSMRSASVDGGSGGGGGGSPDLSPRCDGDAAAEAVLASTGSGSVLGCRPRNFLSAAEPRMTRRVSGPDGSCGGGGGAGEVEAAGEGVLATITAAAGGGGGGGNYSSDGRGSLTSDVGSMSLRSSFASSILSIRSSSMGWGSLRGSGCRSSISSSRGSSPRVDVGDEMKEAKEMTHGSLKASRLSMAAAAVAAKTSRLFARLLGSRRRRRCRPEESFDCVFDVMSTDGGAEVGSYCVSRRSVSASPVLATRDYKK